MRIIPFLTALLVVAVLYMVIIEREALLGYARGEGLSLEDLLTPGPAERDADPAEGAPEVADTSGEAEPAAAEPAQPEAERAGAVAVVAVVSQAREIDSAVILRGETEAARQVDVMAETSGRVISDPLRKGTFVEKGQVLCELDPGTREVSLAEARARQAEAEAKVPEAEARLPEARAQLAQAEAQLQEARINQNAADKLSEGGFASETRVASALAAVATAEAALSSARAGVESAKSGLKSTEAAIQSAEAAVAAAEREIALLTVTAPFAGLLETDTAELGALLQAQGAAGAHCATVIQLDPIKLVGYVPETEVARIETGARAGARLTSGSRELTGKVSFLSRSADPATRTFRVEITVPNEDFAIRDGQTAEIAIEADGAMAHLLPQSSLTLNDEGTLGVRLVGAGNVTEFRPVTLLRDTVNGVWLSGLPDEARVITVGQDYVTEGVPVRPTYEEASQ
ncbi:efflux RND transporter periplasmic adaptor subunit [Aquicoccus sp. SCR17]|nr:efflux RND transporter periplasmic adaptor subunit [Carideicomes alvinocaridis]